MSGMQVNSPTGPGTLQIGTVMSSYLAAMLTWDAGTVRSHPALVNLGPFQVGTEAAQQFQLSGITRATMASYGEGATVIEQEIEVAKGDASSARWALAFKYTDELRYRSPAMRAGAIVNGIFTVAQKTLITNIASLSSSLTGTLGTSGAAFTHDLFMAGKAALEDASVPGPVMCILGNKQFSDWQIDLEGRGGLTQWSAAAAQMQQFMGGSIYKGTYDGIDVFAFPDAPTANAGADYLGMMVGAGCLGFTEEAIPPSDLANVIAASGPLMIEGDREATAGTDTVVGTYRHGVVVIEAARGVPLLSRAS